MKPATRTPRWVYAFGIVFVAVLILLSLIQHFYFAMGSHMGSHAP